MAKKKSGKSLDIRNTNQLNLRDKITGEVKGTVFTKTTQVGIKEKSILQNPSLKTFGVMRAHGGISGSLTRLTDGKSYLVAGAGVTISSASNGQVTFDVGSISPANKLYLNNGFDPYATEYNGTATKNVAILPESNKGLGVTSSGIKIDPANLNTGTPAGTWKLIVSDGANPYAATVNDVLSLGIAGSVTLSNPLSWTTNGGIMDNGGATQYDNTTSVDLKIKLESLKGLATTTAGLKIDPSSLSSATVASGDKVLIGDVDDSDNVKYVTAQSIANLASVGSLANPLSISDGLTPSGSNFNGSAEIHLKVLASNSTISVDSSGVSVSKVPNPLTHGNGIASFSFDGSAAQTITVNPAGNKGIKVSSSGVQLDIANLPINDPTTGDYLAFYDVTEGADGISRTSIQTFVENFVDSAIVNAKAVYFQSPSNGLLTTTGSLALAGAQGYSYGATDAGTDIFLYVSGSKNSRGTAGSKTSLFGGDLVSSGSIFALDAISGSIHQTVSGLSYLVAGSNITIASSSNGQITLSATGGSSLAVSSGSTSVSTVDSIDVSKLGVLQNLGSGDIAITGSIGLSEDGTYTDGLFTDFTSTTPIGTAVDRFNEVLKGLAPSAAPTLDDINSSDSGTSANLSFGSSQSISGYTNAQPSTLTPTDNLSDIDINGTYSSTTVSNDVRIASFAGATVIDGTLNADVAADSPNYAADAFGDGDQGTLNLYVNDNSTPVHSVDLSSFGSGNSLNGNGSGFNLSAVTNGAFSDGSAFSTFKHRTGTYTITVADQRNGWNYARVTHVVGSSTSTTNYVEWVNDPDSNALASAGDAMDSLSMTGLKFLSGVKYNTGGSSQYRIRVTNAYRNVYSTSNITFNGTNCSVSSQAFPAIDYGAGENESKVLHITGSTTITADPILNGSITVSTNVPAPLKSNLSSAGSQSISGILLYDLSNTSTTTAESFRAENYRLISGSYNAQADVGDAGNAWSSQYHMSGTNTGHTDGLLFYNQRLYAPVQGGVSGDFRNTTDGGSITNGPTDNVNYSGITSGLRTFYRYFQNTSGGSKTDFSLTINGSGTIVSQGTSLGSGNISVLAKIPTTSAAFTTGWMDIAVAFATGQTGNGAGCLNGSFDSSLNATNNGTFGTQSVGANEYIMIKIEADAAFTGYVSSMSISWS